AGWRLHLCWPGNRSPGRCPPCNTGSACRVWVEMTLLPETALVLPVDLTIHPTRTVGRNAAEPTAVAGEMTAPAGKPALPGSFSETESGEDPIEEVLGRGLAGDRAECVEGFLQVEGDEFVRLLLVGSADRP